MSTNREADILEAMQYASLDESRRLVAELDQIRANAAIEAQADRDWDAANAIIEDHLTPVLVHGMHSTATDWLDEQVPDYGTADLGSIANTMRTEASVWYRGVHPAVKANRDELREQARGVARRLGSQYGAVANQASDVFMEYVGHLVTAEGTDMAGNSSAAGDSSNPLLDPWKNQPVVDGESSHQGSPPPAADAPDSPAGGIPAAGAPPAPAASSAGEPTDSAPTSENHLPDDETHNNPGNAAATGSPVPVPDNPDTHTSARFETAQQRAIRQYFATEEGSDFPVPGEVDPDQDGEAQSSLPVGVDVSGHPDTFPTFMDQVAPKPAPSTRAPNMTGSRREAVSTGPNPQGSFIYDPIAVEAKGYEEGFAYALTWAPGKAIPSALTSAATIGNKYNSEYVAGYKSGFGDGIDALSPEYQQAYLSAHKQVVMANRKKASPNTLQFGDENQTEAFPFTWSTDGGGGKGAADVGSVPTPGSEVANYPQPSKSEKPEAAVGDESTAIDPDVYDEAEAPTLSSPEKLAAVRATVRRRLGFNVRADQPDDNDGLRPVVDIYDEALYQGLENGLSMEEAELFAERQVERLASKTAEKAEYTAHCGSDEVHGAHMAANGFCVGNKGERIVEKSAGAYGDTSPHQQDWANQLAGIKAQTENCPHCKGAKTRSGDPDAICGPHRDSMRAQYATHPASESYWTSSKTAGKYRECKTCGVGSTTWGEEGGDPPLENGECPECADPYSDRNMGITSSRTPKTAFDGYNWDTGEVIQHFSNDYALYSATRGGWATADDLRELWTEVNPNPTVDVDAVDWASVAADVNEDEE